MLHQDCNQSARMQFAKMSKTKKVSAFELLTNAVGVQICAEKIVHPNIAPTLIHLSVSISILQISVQFCFLPKICKL